MFPEVDGTWSDLVNIIVQWSVNCKGEAEIQRLDARMWRPSNVVEAGQPHRRQDGHHCVRWVVTQGRPRIRIPIFGWSHMLVAHLLTGQHVRVNDGPWALYKKRQSPAYSLINDLIHVPTV